DRGPLHVVDVVVEVGGVEQTADRGLAGLGLRTGLGDVGAVAVALLAEIADRCEVELGPAVAIAGCTVAVTRCAVAIAVAIAVAVTRITVTIAGRRRPTGFGHDGQSAALAAARVPPGGP